MVTGRGDTRGGLGRYGASGAGKIETSRRREVLSWSHHKEVAALEPAEQDILLHRRHLNEGQRSMVAARVANLEEGRPAKTAPIDAVSQHEAADMLNVSRPSVQATS